jgi:1-acyl-sn-glycerol-3-phosphate acyltransferase
MRALWPLINFLQAIFLCAWTALWISLALVAILVTFRRDAALAMARRCWGPGVLAAAGVRLTVSGGEEVDWSQPHVFVSNHCSFLDIPVAFVSLHANLRFVAKSSLAWVPFLGWYMWATGMIFVDRGKSERAISSMRRAGERIRAGASILAYPEGTRSKDGRVGPLKKGAFVVALESRVPVVPIGVAGAADVVPAGGFRVRPGRVHVHVGAPIPTEGLGVDDRHAFVEHVRDAMVAAHDRAVAARG